MPRYAVGDLLIDLDLPEGFPWAAEPGEYYHSFDGHYGGLWRRLGRPPELLWTERQLGELAEAELPVEERDAERGLGERRLDVRRHVVGPLGVVLVAHPWLVAVGDKAGEEALQVGPHGGIGVLLDDQAGRGVADEDRAQPRPQAGAPDDRRHFRGQRVKPRPRDLHGQAFLMDSHERSITPRRGSLPVLAFAYDPDDLCLHGDER